MVVNSSVRSSVSWLTAFGARPEQSFRLRGAAYQHPHIRPEPIGYGGRQRPSRGVALAVAALGKEHEPSEILEGTALALGKQDTWLAPC